jgi:ABC-type nitrate/sulfonate/bicarbonate transport system substrate-binding protein
MSTRPLRRRTLLRATVAATFAPHLARADRLPQVDLLIDWKPAPTYAGFYIAQATGAFRRRGFDVRIAEGRGADIAAEMVGAGQEYWIGSSSGAATAIGRSRGLPIKSLAVYYPLTPTVLFSRAEARIAAPRDLVGKRVGLVPGSTTVEEYQAMLALNRVDRSRIREVAVEPSAKPLLDGRVDALLDYEEIIPAELQAEGRHITVLRLADLGVRLYSLNLVVNEAAWAQREPAARAIAEAVQEGYQLVRERPAEAAAIFGKLFPEFPARYVELSLKIVARQLDQPIGNQTPAGWADTLKLLSDQRLLTRTVTPDEIAIWR